MVAAPPGRDTATLTCSEPLAWTSRARFTPLNSHLVACEWWRVNGGHSHMVAARHVDSQVHGESAANTAVTPLLYPHLGFPVHGDVSAALEELARCRANACMEALLSLGVSSDRVFTTFAGQGAVSGVDFIPRPQACLPPFELGPQHCSSLLL